jgi:hypothetical protein
VKLVSKLFEGASVIHMFVCPPCFYYRLQEVSKYDTGVEYHIKRNATHLKDKTEMDTQTHRWHVIS